MPIMQTNLRSTRESAKQLRYYPVSPFVAKNVQDAIDYVVNALGLTPKVVNVAMSPYTPAPTDRVLLVDTSGGAVTIQMPLAATRVFDLEVKDASGNAAANPISILRAGAETIDGMTTYPVDSNFASVNLGPKTGGYYAHA